MVIGHCRTKFLPITEVFIENQIFESENIKPIILTRKLDEKYLNATMSHGIIHGAKIFSFHDNSFSRFFKKMSKREGDYFSNVILRERVKLLHIHFGTDAWYFLNLKKITKMPIIVSFYGYDAYKFPKMFFGLGKTLLRQVFKRADAIIVPSWHMKKHLMVLGCDDVKIQIIPWGVRIKIINEQLRQTTSDKSIKFITIGRMVEKKGQNYLLEAFKKVLDSGINGKLTIVGQGQLKKKLVKTIDKFGIYDKVNIIDKLSNQKVIQALMSHNIYVQPSVVAKNGDQEGIPTAIMEAMTCSLPIIATEHSGIPEIVENNVSGILVPERDSEKLAEAMVLLANSQKLRLEFGRNGRKIVQEKYNVIKQNKKLEELYEREINSFNSNV